MSFYLMYYHLLLPTTTYHFDQKKKKRKKKDTPVPHITLFTSEWIEQHGGIWSYCINGYGYGWTAYGL